MLMLGGGASFGAKNRIPFSARYAKAVLMAGDVKGTKGITAETVARGDRAALARAITLMESRRPDHRAAARDLLQDLLPRTGGAVRVGITGVPGVGKSTAIDSLGSLLTAQGHRVAVLAVDPSSTRTGGAILGDKTRMARLAGDPNAFIRPSPTSGTLGGVAAKTRETMLLCEAAGFDVILVETVGVGQSETAVADLTDFFLVLMLPGAGDELQGIKKGILELADMIAVNKADDAGARAKAAAAEYKAALHILTPASAAWTPPVATISGLTGQGLDDLWAKILDHRGRLEATGELAAKRRTQDAKWMWALVHERLHEKLVTDKTLKSRLPEIERKVADGVLAPNAAADEIAALLGL
jgi:GTPase